MERNIMLTSLLTQSALPLHNIIFVRIQGDLKTHGGDSLWHILNLKYADRLYFNYFAGYSPIIKIKFPLEPVSIVISTMQTKSWARRFAAN